MIRRFDEESFQKICDELALTDKDLAAIIAEHRYPPMWTRPNSFESLVHIILEQQVSLDSARAALNKLRERLGEITPKRLLELDDEEMKACYFSRQKMIYARVLAEAILDGSLDLAEMESLPDDEVRARLIRLKGIGHWTIDVYLMFVLQRSDIFPIGDLAAVNALRRVKQFPRETPREELLRIAAGWEPYRTVATMILWHLYLSSPRNKRGG